MLKGGGGGVQVQNLVSNWQKVLCLHSLHTEERNMRGLCLTSCTPLALLAIFFKHLLLLEFLAFTVGDNDH